MDGQVNIPKSVDDEYYRYRRFVAQVEYSTVRGGITTIVNLPTISRQLGIEQLVIAKYVAYSLKTKMDKSMRLFGNHRQETIEEKIEDFIREIILCRRCGNPEGVYEIREDGIWRKCRACGKTYLM